MHNINNKTKTDEAISWVGLKASTLHCVNPAEVHHSSSSTMTSASKEIFDAGLLDGESSINPPWKPH